MHTKVLFPGSFDPITNGHIEVIDYGLGLFDTVVVGLGINTSKSGLFAPEDRLEWIRRCYAHEPRVQVEVYNGLTVHFAQQIGASHMLRGLRTAVDFEYEKSIALINRQICPDVRTLFMIAGPEWSHISSTLVRELLRFGGSLNGLLPDAVLPDVQAAAAQKFRS